MTKQVLKMSKDHVKEAIEPDSLGHSKWTQASLLS